MGLVGPSGSGKSSLIKLLLRMFELDGGKILIDNQDISTVSINSLRKHIAVIPQDAGILCTELWLKILDMELLM